MDQRMRQMGGRRCEHGYPVEVKHVEVGRVARCLGCGQTGPARPSSERALAALRDEPRRYLEQAG